MSIFTLCNRKFNQSQEIFLCDICFSNCSHCGIYPSSAYHILCAAIKVTLFPAVIFITNKSACNSVFIVEAVLGSCGKYQNWIVTWSTRFKVLNGNENLVDLWCLWLWEKLNTDCCQLSPRLHWLEFLQTL